jgi:1,2-diacylglycerol 3-beta-glucosyltransferase
MFELIFVAGLSLVAAWASCFVLYQLLWGCLYFLIKDKPSEIAESSKRFLIFIPAHDEELILGIALESWQTVQYPRGLFQVCVIADNSTDRTAEIARSSGAICLERTDIENRGKGQALAWAMKEVPIGEYDAVVIVDADCTVSPGFLSAMNQRLIGGARVIQGFDGVLNPDDSMMTRLMHITNVMKNLLFSHAKSKLGFSVHLMGTGMCFDRKTLQEVAWKAFSIGEDLEQFGHLAAAGVRVEFEPRAVAYAQEASSMRQAYSQRVRWASARMQLLGVGARLFLAGLRNHNFHLVEAGISLLCPNYSMLANVTLAGLFLSLFALSPPARNILSWWFALLVAAQVLYFFMGIMVSKLSLKALCSLGFAPVFLLWKLGVDVIAVLNLRRSLWVRTSRSPHAGKP